MSKSFPPLRAPALSIKSVFASKTLIGIAVALIAKLTGVAEDDLSGVVVHATTAWPAIIGILADLGAMVSRIRLQDFDKSIFARRDFWLQIVSAVMTAAAAFGYDLSALDGIIAKGLDAWPAIAAIIGSAIGIIGSLTAKQRLTVATPPSHTP